MLTLGWDLDLRAFLLLQARTVPGSVEGIRDALNWAGLDYDYGE